MPAPSMHIGILVSSYEESESPFRGKDGDCDPSPYFPENSTWEYIPLHKRNSAQRVSELAQGKYDLFFNLCDGAKDEDRAGIEVVWALESLGCAFTGATSHFYEPTREDMKRVCRTWGIRTPNYVFAKNERGIRRCLRELRFPMIVKHENSYGSIGMGERSKVMTPEDLRREVEVMSSLYGGALVEEFIEGREFTVFVTENFGNPQAPFTYRPAECQFLSGRNTFKHFDLKWVDYDFMSWVPVSKREEDGLLERRLQEMAALMFRGHRGTGYGRCDIRMDGQGNLFMLEINPNCGLFYPEHEFGSADTILSYEDRGHYSFVENQIQLALHRQAQTMNLDVFRHEQSVR